MPAILTHDFFGHDALASAEKLMGPLGPDERDAFILGNQGPDPLFYLVIDPAIDKRSRVGELMHHRRPAHLLSALVAAARSMDEPSARVARAWVAGVFCHYLLDSTMHPFVYFWQYGLTAAGVEGLDEDASGSVHAEVERDLDEMVLYKKLGITIADYPTYSEVLECSDEALAVLDRVLAAAVLSTYGIAIAPHTMSHAVKSFRIVQRIFYSPSGLTHRVAGGVERGLMGKRFSFYCAMAHRVRAQATSDFDNRERKPWRNPFTSAVSNDSFWDLYNKALEKVPSALSAMLDPSFDVDVAEMLCGGLNFSGEPVGEGLAD